MELLWILGGLYILGLTLYLLFSGVTKKEIIDGFLDPFRKPKPNE